MHWSVLRSEYDGFLRVLSCVDDDDGSWGAGSGYNEKKSCLPHCLSVRPSPVPSECTFDASVWILYCPMPLLRGARQWYYVRTSFLVRMMLLELIFELP